MPLKNYYEALQANFSRAIPHALECGLVIDRLDAEGAEASVPYRDEWLGDSERGLLHPGILTTLVDTVSGLAALAATGGFDPIATLDLRMDYLRPALPGAALRARAECFRLTRSIAFVRASAWQDQPGQPVAVSQSTFMRNRRPAGRRP
jgi:uncharacterized protein (TIGR00369 family)